MNLFTITFKSNTPYYIQIYDKIKNDILNNIITANEKLPSKRKLASHLNVSLTTICSAYNLLIEEGYLLSLEKKGYYALNHNIKLNFNQNILINNQQKETNYLYDFTTKNIDKSSFPFYTWNKISKDILYSNPPGLLDKTPNKGDINLRHTLRDYLFETRNFVSSIDNIIIGSSIEYLLSILCNIIDSKNYALENPGYPKITNILTNNKMNITYIDVMDNGLNIEMLKQSLADVCYITPYNQFPTGKKMSMSAKLELVSWAKNNKYLIEDDFDSEFRIIGKPSISLCSLTPQNTIFLANFSRTLAPSIRLSYMVLPSELTKVYDKHYNNYSNTVSTLEQMVVAKFINDGFYTRHLNKVKNIYRHKRKKIIEYLSTFKDIIEVNTEDSYLSLLIKIKTPYEKEILKRNLNSSQIDINFLSDYGLVKDDYLIIGYSAIEDIKILSGLEIIINKLKSKN